MKTINLISDSEFFKPSHFQVLDFYGKETVTFYFTEQEFVHKSVYFGIYTNDLKILPRKVGNTGTTEYGECRNYYCPTDFYIVVDKGVIGFDSITFVSKCHVEETDTEFIVSIQLETDDVTTTKVLEAYKQNDYSVSYFLHENFFSRINSYATPVPELVKKLEETPFLDVDTDFGETTIPLNINEHGEYQLKPHPKNYDTINPQEPLAVGIYLFTSQIHNTVEIAEITGFAHSMYGIFHAIVKTAYVYPMDSKELKKKFPDFYKEHCMSDSEKAYRDFVGSPESLSFIPTDCHIGDTIIYQQLKTANACFGVSDKVFQFTLSEGAGFGDYQQSNGAFIRVCRGALAGILIQVDGRFKIMFYKCTDVVKYKGKYFVRFKYEDESEFFNDFSSSGKSTFKKYHHRNACRNVEYLLCRDKIKPVAISKEQYDSFSNRQ